MPIKVVRLTEAVITLVQAATIGYSKFPSFFSCDDMDMKSI